MAAEPSRGMTPPGLTPLSYLERAAAVAHERVATVEGDVRRSWGELHERCARLAGALRALGLEDGDRVAVLSPNCAATLEAHFGVPAAGGVLVALNTRLDPAELRFILEDAAPRFVLVDPELEQLLPEGAGRRVPLGAAYEQLLAGAQPVASLMARAGDERRAISLNYTSGTTGTPKGAIYTHRGAFLQALNAARAIDLDEDAVYLWTLPMFHCNGWSYPWAVTAALARHVLLDAVDPARIWELVEAEGVTHWCCAPTVQLDVVNHAAARPLARPVGVAIGGAPPSPTLIEQMRALGFEALHLYGLTETYGPKVGVRARHDALAGLDAAGQARLLARQGHALSPTDAVRVVGEDFADVPPDGETTGEVVIRGETVTPGYFRREEATASAFRDGWLLTGDLAVWHPDGSIELRDRTKDVIISGGENISSIEVEQALVAHPAVLDAAVVAMPHPRWGERPKAFVTLRPGAEATAPELIAFCRERIAHFKCPDAVDFGPLPKTATGKVRKRELREREWGAMERRIN